VRLRVGCDPGDPTICQEGVDLGIEPCRMPGLAHDIAAIGIAEKSKKLKWLGLSEQRFRLAKWSVCWG
jgi:hypothetical protein